MKNQIDHVLEEAGARAWRRQTLRRVRRVLTASKADKPGPRDFGIIICSNAGDPELFSCVRGRRADLIDALAKVMEREPEFGKILYTAYMVGEHFTG